MKTIKLHLNGLVKRLLQFALLLALFYLPGYFILLTTLFSETTALIFKNIVILSPFVIMACIIAVDTLIAVRRGRS